MAVGKNRIGMIFAAGVLLGLTGMTGCGTAPQKIPQGAEAPAVPPAETEAAQGQTELQMADGAEEGMDASSSDAPEAGMDVSSSDALPKDDFGVSQGEASTETFAELSFAKAEDGYGMPQEAIDQLGALNRGEPPREALGMASLEGYYALVGTTTVIGREKESGTEMPGRGRLTIYVPNLLSGLEDVSVLFYDNGAGRWRILAAEKADAETKKLSVILPGSGTLTVIHRGQR